MEYSVEFIKYITECGKLEIIKNGSTFIMKCSGKTATGANIETALMLLIMKLKGKI